MNQALAAVTLIQVVVAASMLAAVLMVVFTGLGARRTRNGSAWRALTGVVFAALFLLQSVLGDALATTPLPLPGAPAMEIVHYFTESQSAVVAVAVSQILTAIALFIFAEYVAEFVRRMQNDRSVLPGLARAGGILASVFVVASGLFALALVPVAAGTNLALVDLLRNLNFWSGGTLHVASLGVFSGSSSIAARGRNALPGWIVWLGIVSAGLSILSLASLVLFPATLLILVGRWLGFFWSIGVGIVLARTSHREPTSAEPNRLLVAR